MLYETIDAIFTILTRRKIFQNVSFNEAFETQTLNLPINYLNLSEKFKVFQ